MVVEAGAPAVDGHGALDEQRARVGRAGEADAVVDAGQPRRLGDLVVGAAGDHGPVFRARPASRCSTEEDDE
jgi:hypothetical protein